MPITKSNFEKGFMDKCVKPTHALRETKQEYFLFAMDQAGKKNFTFINLVANADLGGDDRRAINKYFEDYCDVKYDTASKKYINCKTRGFKYVPPTKNWWEYKPTPEVSFFDLEHAILTAIHKAKLAQAGKGKIKLAKGKVAQTKKQLAFLTQLPGVDKDKLKKALAA